MVAWLCELLSYYAFKTGVNIKTLVEYVCISSYITLVSVAVVVSLFSCISKTKTERSL